MMLRKAATILVVITMLGPAFAATMSDGTTTLNSTINSGGSSQMTDGTSNLQDVKGDPVGGSMTDGAYNLGSGGIYGTGSAAKPAPAVGGIITETKIFRLTDGKIKLAWNKGSTPAVDIWRLSGPGVEFDAKGAWRKIVDSKAASDHVEPPDQIKTGDGNNAYYRVVPANTALADIQKPELNNITVGKVDINLKSRYNSVSLPLVPSNYSFGSVLGNQLSLEDQVHAWSYDNQNYIILTKAPGGWPSGNFSVSEGFLLYLATKKNDVLSVVGFVEEGLPAARTLRKKYEAIGLPFPQGKTWDKLGLTPREEDQIHTWNYNNQNYEITTYGPKGWNDPAKAGLGLADGKLYYIPESSDVLDWDPRLVK